MSSYDIDMICVLQHYKEANCHRLAMEDLLYNAGVDMIFSGEYISTDSLLTGDTSRAHADKLIPPRSPLRRVVGDVACCYDKHDDVQGMCMHTVPPTR